ncbi:MbnP family copper-binding protein [Algicola sagamiensis]|uniref:MbnP family copper-binding protein n=1 Tax=Algicola sagamiensis TaxID=163869 RepID=UPI00037C4A94|nr:MbnP family copper-binding protein [Algicola sagamiensis]
MKKTALFLTFPIFSLLSACGGSSDNPTPKNSPEPQTEMKSYTIHFAAKVADQPIACQQMTDAPVGTTGVSPEFRDFRMYISQVKLVNDKNKSVELKLKQDGAWQYQNVALLDFENGQGTCKNATEAMNTKIIGSAPQDNYTAIEFTIGVPKALNHKGIDGEDAVSPLDVAGMNWTWQKGHKHMRIDVKNMFIHLGTTGCEVTNADKEDIDCTNARPNRPNYQLKNFDPAKSTIVFDYAALIKNNDISVSSNCMSSPTEACTDLYQTLGLDIDRGVCPDGEESLCSTQSWVRVE